VAHTSDYTDFELDIRPTNDFINKLLSYDQNLVVLEPADLRLKIREILVESLKKY
jgi:predicted DNA-binding transcriptional regulator YafY